MVKDYYGILEVDRKATDKEIKAAYRRKARKYHPDVNPGDNQAAEKFKEVSEAYAILGDPDRKKQYDRFGVGFEQNDMPPGADFMGGGGIDLESIFENFMGGGIFSSARPEAHPRDLEIPLGVNLRDIDTGVTQTVTYQTDDSCPNCKAAGYVRRGNSRATCPTCAGRGTVTKPRRVEVNIPAGVPSGQRLRVSGGGHRGANGKGGDLYLLVTDNPDPEFKRKDGRLEVQVDLPYTTAALGGDITVPTLRGKGKVRVPAGTQSGQVLRLKGQGITQFRSKQRGDLYARVRVTVPTTLTPREKELLEQLQAGGESA